MRHKFLQQFKDGRNKEDELETYQSMMEFDWGEAYERVMQRLTNDISEFLTPQASHVLFTEFVKFMFLNYCNLYRLK